MNVNKWCFIVSVTDILNVFKQEENDTQLSNKSVSIQSNTNAHISLLSPSFSTSASCTDE